MCVLIYFRSDLVLADVIKLKSCRNADDIKRYEWEWYNCKTYETCCTTIVEVTPHLFQCNLCLYFQSIWISLWRRRYLRTYILCVWWIFQVIVLYSSNVPPYWLKLERLSCGIVETGDILRCLCWRKLRDISRTK